MKINNVNLPIVNPYKANESNVQKAKQNSNLQTDKIEISSKAKQLSETSSFTIERNDRIAEIKKQIDAGTYQVNAKEIAESLVSYFKQ